MQLLRALISKTAGMRAKRLRLNPFLEKDIHKGNRTSPHPEATLPRGLPLQLNRLAKRLPGVSNEHSMKHALRKALATLTLFTAMTIESRADASLETIDLAAGCFWCTEAVMQRVEGVKEAVSGYMGGQVENPTYKQVVTGTTGHAEIARIVFAPDMVSLDEILEIFWLMHDPTSLNKQGADVGTQYRSAVFYHSEAQKNAVEASIAALNESGKYDRPIVTEVTAAETFYPAEDYHQEYYDLNKRAGYCVYVIHPKLVKLGLED